jgi:bcr-type benzoyl-CoA reductase subunit C
MKTFYDAATKLHNNAIMKWKEAGKKVVGYTCSYTPAEIFHCVDILAIRLRGIETDGMDISDSYYGPFICSFPKCILQLAGKGKYSFLDGTIITPGCDALRRLDECWRKAGDDHEGIVPSYFYYFDVPHKIEPHGMEWYIQEIRDLIKSVEDHFEVKITDDMLNQSIKVFNKGRKLLKELADLRCEEDVPVTGTDAFAAVVAGKVTPRDEFTKDLEKWIATLKEDKTPQIKNQKRLMLIGSITDEIDLVELIEENTNAVIVAENLCFGVRYENWEVPEDGDPVAALAGYYLGQSVCPRMYGKYKQRLARLVKKIKRAKVDGVVMQNIRFCDLHGAENALFERDLEAMGIPCIRIEREYGPLIETGRIKLRINAFLERIS